MAFETWNSGQQSPGYMLDKFGPPILGLTGPRAHIVHTSKNSSNVPNFHVTPVETICNTNENLNFYLFWSFLRPKRAQIYGPRGHDSHTPGITFDILVNQVSWLHSTNFFPKMTQNLNFELFCSFSVQNIPQIWPLVDMVYAHLKVPQLCLLTKFHDPVKTVSKNENDKKNLDFDLFVYPDMPVKQVSWSLNKNSFWKTVTPPLPPAKMPFFEIFLLIKAY